MALDGNGLYTTANKTCHSIVYQLGKINYPHHAKILQHNANFQLADALLLMYAKMCILHGSVSDTLCNLSPSEQLMYLPASGAVPDTIQVMEPPSLFIVFFKFFIPRCIVQESEVPLKKILLWNGASSWGSLKPGRGVFLKVTFCSVKHQVKYRVNLSPNNRPCYHSQEKCPVSSCVLSSSRQEADTADLVIFKDHFTMPTFRLELSTNLREDFTVPGKGPY